MKRKIAVVTGTRAEYGILKPLMKKIEGSPKLELELIITGMHLLKKYGYTFREIVKEFTTSTIVPMYSKRDEDDSYHGLALARGLKNFTRSLIEIKPDLLVVIGDRLEALAVTLAAATLRIPIAHIQGGDKTDSGHIDEPIRHAITRFAHIHFPATQMSVERLRKMGEEPWRIHNVGALGLDSILSIEPISEKKLSNILKMDLSKPIIVCIFHPLHLEKEKAGQQMHEILEALKEIRVQTIIIYPNNDAGSEHIIEEIERCKDLPFIRSFPTLPHEIYVSLLKNADVLIGNSSCGIVEAPSIGLPVVNIGSRNVGREHAENVIFVRVDKKEIREAIRKALYDPTFKERVLQCENPYGEGKAASKIVNLLSEVKLGKRLLRKTITC